MWSKLSSSFWELQDRYGVLVVGSGYGGAIVAARLAQQGHSVCVVERGKEFTVGSFPDDLDHVEAEVRTPHNPLGLYDYRAGHDLDVFSGSGLGGTSLVNANVAIRPDPAVFAGQRWPKELQDEAASGALYRYYDRAAATLGVSDPDFDTAKARAQQKAAAGVGRPLLRTQLTVHQGAEGPNQHGVHSRPCTRCGDCVSGCNVGAKNTLMMSYLPLAKAAGAKLITQTEVRFLLESPAADGYYVFLRHHAAQFAPPVDRVVFARTVVLGAGALGSTGILLRSRERGLDVGGRVGHHFSSNADQLGLAYNTDQRTDVLGFGARPEERAKHADVGPTIMRLIDYRSPGSLGASDFIVEEGAIPRAMVDIARRVAVVAAASGDDTDSGWLDEARELKRIVADTFSATRDGALNHSMVYLGMGHDGADGRVTLDPSGTPRVIWGAVGWRQVFESISRAMRGLTTQLGGTFVENPRWSRLLGKNPITVHPLGGCPMGEDASSGAVSHMGQVFRADGRPHAGLYVSDASIVPTSLGVNPFLTISALAERVAEKLHDEATGKLEVPPSVALAVPGWVEPAPGIEFTEKMRGHLTRSVIDATTPDAYRAAEATAKGEADGSFEFRLTIVVDDVRRFIESPEHLASAEGYVTGGGFGTRLLVEEGRFNLFIEDAAAHTKRMIYRLTFTGDDGERYLLDGYKEIKDDPGFDAWADTTTLFTTIRRGTRTDSPPVAQGIIHVQFADFLRQLTTFRARNEPSLGAGAAVIGRFGQFFFGDLWDTYVKHQVPGEAAPE